MKAIGKLNIIALNVWFYFWAPFVLAACLAVLLPTVAIVRLVKPSRAMYCFRRAIAVYGRAVTLTAWPWIRVNIHNLPPPKGIPYVFVENHASSFDPFVQAMLPYEVVQAARGWALRFPVLGFFARWAGYIDVDGESSEVVDRAVRMLRSKVSVVFFPEGTRGDGISLAPFHSAAFRAAHETGAQVVPLLVRGIADKPAKGSFVIHPGLIDMQCLEAVSSEVVSKTKPFELKRMVRQEMQDALAQSPGAGK